jgi:hypothetical protein
VSVDLSLYYPPFYDEQAEDAQASTAHRAAPISEWKLFSIAGSATDSAVTQLATTPTVTAIAAMARTPARPERLEADGFQAGRVTTMGGRGSTLTSSLKTSGRP